MLSVPLCIILFPWIPFLLEYKFPKDKLFITLETVSSLIPTIPPKTSELPVILTLLIEFSIFELTFIFPAIPPILSPSAFILPSAIQLAILDTSLSYPTIPPIPT